MSGQERKLPPAPSSVDHFTITCDDIPKFLGAESCHNDGIDGDGIVVGIVDSGYYDHKYFEIKRAEWEKLHNSKGWRYPTVAFPPVQKITGEPMVPEPELDKTGHGTGMAANLYSVAPRALLRMYPVQSFMQSLEAAVEQCDVISLSKHNDVTGHADFVARYRAALTKARDNGKVVVHAAGNGTTTPWPVTNCPELVMKIGGVHRKKDGNLEASNYARANAGTQRSDLCGLCGPMPSGAYIWLPADPDHKADEQFAPGWNLASGTSSATPQVAGVIALMQQARKRNHMDPLNLATATSILKRTATPVTVGQSYDGVAAAASWCSLVNAEAAVRMAVQ